MSEGHLLKSHKRSCYPSRDQAQEVRLENELVNSSISLKEVKMKSFFLRAFVSKTLSVKCLALGGCSLVLFL